MPEKTAVNLNNMVLSQSYADGMANSVDPDQTDQGLHCFPRPVFLKTSDHHGKVVCTLKIIVEQIRRVFNDN